MKNIISQKTFTNYASAWVKFIVGAGSNDIQQLFQGTDAKQAQLYVAFDMAGTIVPLLSTVGIAMVRMRFVLLSTDADKPSFGIVVYAADNQGGRISAYYLGTSRFMPFADQVKSCESMRPAPHKLPQTDSKKEKVDLATSENDAVSDGNDTDNGIVPFNLAKTWVCNWCWAIQEGSLDPTMFATGYGPLQGFDFALGDFLDPLFQMKNFEVSHVRTIFGLKRYYPVYPENLALPTSTFEVVIRPYSPASDNPTVNLTDLATHLHARDGGPTSTAGGDTGGASYDHSTTYPPGI